jgi:hypothetical protein
MHPAEAPYVEAILQDTWGHLAPKPKDIYQGFIIIAKSTFSGHGTIPLEFELRNGAGELLQSSPWFYEDLNEFCYTATKDKPTPDDWGLWKWEGTYERLKNGKTRWRGKARPLRITYRFGGASKK